MIDIDIDRLEREFWAASDALTETIDEFWVFAEGVDAALVDLGDIGFLDWRANVMWNEAKMLAHDGLGELPLPDGAKEPNCNPWLDEELAKACSNAGRKTLIRCAMEADWKAVSFIGAPKKRRKDDWRWAWEGGELANEVLVRLVDGHLPTEPAKVRKAAFRQARKAVRELTSPMRLTTGGGRDLPDYGEVSFVDVHEDDVADDIVGMDEDDIIEALDEANERHDAEPMGPFVVLLQVLMERGQGSLVSAILEVRKGKTAEAAAKEEGLRAVDVIDQLKRLARIVNPQALSAELSETSHERRLRVMAENGVASGPRR